MPSKSPVVCMDGDGALLMHMGSMATNKAENLVHVLVGGAEDWTCDLTKLVRLTMGCMRVSEGSQQLLLAWTYVVLPEMLGSPRSRVRFLVREFLPFSYPTAIRVRTEEELSSAVADAVAQPHSGPVFIEVLVKPGVRSDLGRPTTTPQGNKVRLLHLPSWGKYFIVIFGLSMHWKLLYALWWPLMISSYATV